VGDTANTSSGKLNAAKVFVSYAREDKEFARQLSFALEDKGFGALMDVRAIVPGENWQLRLLNLIDQSTSIVVVLSDAYLNSEACGWEVNEAEKRGKRMLCVLPQRLTDGGKVPDVLAKDQHIFFYADSEVPDSGFYDGVRKLEMGLRQNLDWLTLQRRYELLADEWRSGKSETGLLIGSSLAEARTWAAGPPEKMRVPEEVAAFLAESEKAEDKRQRKVKRDRAIAITTFVTGVVLILAVVATALLYGRAASRLANAETALTDMQNETNALARDADIAVKAAELYAAGRAELSTFRSLRKIEVERKLPYGAEGNLGAAGQASSYLDQANGMMADLSEKSASRFISLADSIRRDIAGAAFAGDSEKAEAALDIVISHQTDLASDDVLRQLAFDYVARAVYSCTNPERIGRIASELNAAPEAARAQFLWQTVSTVASGKTVCEEARAAICAQVPDCPVSRGPAADDAGQEADDAKVNYSLAQVAAYDIREIYFHIAAESDRDQARKVRDAIQAIRTPDGKQKYKVLGIQLVDAGIQRSVRYYYAPQDEQAEELRDIVARLAGETGRPDWSNPETYRVMSLAGKYDGLPPHRVEVWF
jgi:hypothetical protein